MVFVSKMTGDKFVGDRALYKDANDNANKNGSSFILKMTPTNIIHRKEWDCVISFPVNMICIIRWKYKTRNKIEIETLFRIFLWALSFFYEFQSLKGIRPMVNAILNNLCRILFHYINEELSKCFFLQDLRRRKFLVNCMHHHSHCVFKSQKSFKNWSTFLLNTFGISLNQTLIIIVRIFLIVWQRDLTTNNWMFRFNEQGIFFVQNQKNVAINIATNCRAFIIAGIDDTSFENIFRIPAVSKHVYDKHIMNMFIDLDRLS